tara:strand:- start:16 stop:489 length:474 start_codon:yes stop_codon:yes gene_type:complete
MRKSKYTRELLEPIVARSKSIRGVMKELGMRLNAGGSHWHLSKKIKELGLDTTHFTGQGHLKGKQRTWQPPIALEKVLVKRSTYSRCHLKSRLLKEGLLKSKCALCGLKDEWNGRLLVLHLDHINGVNDDNRLKNLRMLCPNCHSQQSTYSGKNRKA